MKANQIHRPSVRDLGRVFALALICSYTLPAQSTAEKILDFNHHGWYVYGGDHRIAGRWGVHFDAQWRRADLGVRWQQLLLRPAVNFSLTPNVTLSGGYAYIRTYPYGNYPQPTRFPEHRIYQQAVLRQPRKSVNLSHRFRLEQRFLRYPTTLDRSWTYQNRFRYMLRADFPLAKSEGGRASWYLPVWNEVFLGLAPNYGARSFDQNRFFVGIGKSIPWSSNLEVGYMKQVIGQRNGRIFEWNNTLSITWSSTYDLSSLWN